MRLLIDENISPVIGAALSAAGHDVLAATDACPGASDAAVIALAVADGRIIVSDDKDFGELAFRDGLRPPGLVRVVLPGLRPAEKAARLVAVLAEAGDHVPGAVLVVEPQRTRVRSLP